jgi:hypothetical protein
MSHRLSFLHPFSGQPVTVVAVAAPDWIKAGRLFDYPVD